MSGHAATVGRARPGETRGQTDCDTEECPRPAAQVGTVDLPIKPLELRLCDEHVEALRAGKLQGMSQGRLPRWGGRCPRLE